MASNVNRPHYALKSGRRSHQHTDPSLQIEEGWPTFMDILQRLHQEGIYIHQEQLAEFFLFHGLPVDLSYVPSHLQKKAIQINAHYQGDMARLEDCH